MTLQFDIVDIRNFTVKSCCPGFPSIVTIANPNDKPITIIEPSNYQVTPSIRPICPINPSNLLSQSIPPSRIPSNLTNQYIPSHSLHRSHTTPISLHNCLTQPPTSSPYQPQYHTSPHLPSKSPPPSSTAQSVPSYPA